ncbi:MAG TPA: hypothetical protein VFO10_24450 [Oligoflexus sp.]|uniref:hypothetical protein n=1 Tax=Oligoflexus sp. TaxID=1971216 RepID=UPI002D7E9899|nr:hypothetical protein [Oligoflexus sp.]HET9240438.1 hypothetical protein [Oligoflexus sp.]
MMWFCRFPALLGLACLLTQCVQNQPDSELMDKASPEAELQDFSYAGYRQGLGVIASASFAEEQVIEAPHDGREDASPAFQKAFAAAMSKGVSMKLRIPEGTYRLDQTVQIIGRNILLQGAGADKTRLIFTNPDAKLMLGEFTGTQSPADGSWKLSADAAIGDRTLTVTNSTGLKIGDDIVVTFKLSPEFIAEHQASPWWDGQLGNSFEIFRRQVTALDGQKVTLDTPLRYPVKIRDQAELKRLTRSSSELGLEGIGVHNAAESVTQAWEAKPGSSPLLMVQCRDCYVRNVSSFPVEGKVHHLLSHGLVIRKSYRVTVDNVHMAHTQNRGPGGSGYLFMVAGSNEVLIKNSSGTAGRHNLTFVGRFANSGNVVHKFRSSGGRICSTLEADLANNCSVGPVDTHESLAIANLFDLIELDDGLEIGNRQDKSNNVGPTGTLNVIWNVKGSGFVNSYNTGTGYVFGSEPGIKLYYKLDESFPKARAVALNTGAEDSIQSAGQMMPEPSLYVLQLKKRRNQK